VVTPFQKADIVCQLSVFYKKKTEIIHISVNTNVNRTRPINVHVAAFKLIKGDGKKVEDEWHIYTLSPHHNLITNILFLL
jgi:hypothetical protein